MLLISAEGNGATENIGPKMRKRKPEHQRPADGYVTVFYLEFPPGVDFLPNDLSSSLH